MEVNCILPDDLVQPILSRLPVQDLLRFKCVCKGWCALIDSPSFIRHHYQVKYSISKLDGNIPHFGYDLLRGNEGFYLLSVHQGHVSTVDLNDDIERDCFNMFPWCCDAFLVEPYGCVNGVILLQFSFNCYPELNYLGLWNPSTREFKSVSYPFAPGLSFDLSVNGFGFDMISNDFKILGTYQIISEGIYYHDVYSLRTSTWKRLSLPPVSGLSFSGTDGYLNGVHYWYGSPEHESEMNSVMVSFDYSSEIYKVSNFPEDAKSLILGASQVMIALYKESIGLFISRAVQQDSLLYKVDIWAVTGFDDFGVPLSWQHLFTVRPTLTPFRVDVATARMDGDLLLTYRYMMSADSEDAYVDGKEYLYNPSKAEFKYFGDRIAHYYRYIESLFPLSSWPIEY